MILRVFIVETGISPTELDCQSLEVVISMRVVMLRELTFIIETMLSHLLVSIAVIFLLMLSIIILTSQ